MKAYNLSSLSEMARAKLGIGVLTTILIVLVSQKEIARQPHKKRDGASTL